MLSEVKLYFNITDNKYDAVIQLIIDKVEQLQKALLFSEDLIFQCVVEDFSRYLRSGNKAFTTSQAADISRYSVDLYKLIKRSMKVRVYAGSSTTMAEVLSTINRPYLGLYTITYPSMLSSYTDANRYLRRKFVKAGCSGFVNRAIHGRAYDFYRTNSACVIVNTPATKRTLASISVANGISALTPELLDSKLPDNIYNYLPYMVVDGINSAHISVQVNMLPKDIPPTKGTNPGKPGLCSAMVTRLILDYCKDISSLKELLDQYNIYDPQVAPLNCAYQWLVSTPLDSYLVYIKDNEVHVEQCNYITNFNPFIYTKHAQGLERYSIIESELPAVRDVPTAFALLRELKYSQAYDENTTWYSEFFDTYSDGFDWDRETDPTLPRCQQILATARQMYLDDDPSTWHTSHAVVYNTITNTMHIIINEEYYKIYSVTL